MVDWWKNQTQTILTIQNLDVPLVYPIRSINIGWHGPWMRQHWGEHYGQGGGTAKEGDVLIPKPWGVYARFSVSWKGVHNNFSYVVFGICIWASDGVGGNRNTLLIEKHSQDLWRWCIVRHCWTVFPFYYPCSWITPGGAEGRLTGRSWHSYSLE